MMHNAASIKSCFALAKAIIAVEAKIRPADMLDDREFIHRVIVNRVPMWGNMFISNDDVLCAYEVLKSGPIPYMVDVLSERGVISDKEIQEVPYTPPEEINYRADTIPSTDLDLDQ